MRSNLAHGRTLLRVAMLAFNFLVSSFSLINAQTVVIDENFANASGSTAPTGWTATLIAEGNWAFDNPGSRNITGGTPGFSGKFAIFDSDYICSNSGGEEAILESPVFNASAPGTYTLEFDNSYRESWRQEAHVAVWNGTTWTDVLTLTTSTTGDDGYPNPTHKSIDITAATGASASAKVRFHSTEGECDWWWAVDNVKVTRTPPITCANPTGPTATAVTTNSASLNWMQTGIPSQWQIKYGPAGFNVNTAGTSVFTSTKPYTLDPPLTPATAYSYYVRAICGSNDTSAWSAVTNFTTLCVPPAIVSKTDSFNCGPGIVVLNASATAGGSIKWYSALTGGTALFTGNAFTTPVITANTTYYITAASGTCESTPRQAIVASIRPIPIVNIGNDTTICPGITYTMDAGNTGASYNWNTGSTTQSVTAVAAGNYSVQVTLNNCSSSDTCVISTGVVPQNNLAATLDLCTGNIATLNAGNTGSSFLWAPGGETTQSIQVNTGGVRSVTIRSMTGCEINSNIAITLRPLPVVNLGNDTAFCRGNVLILNAENSGNSFLWNTGAISQTINVDTTGNYIVWVTDNFSCIGKDTIGIVVKAAPSGTINAIYGDIATYTFNIIDPKFISSYTWDFGDGSATANGATVQHRYLYNGTFTVSVKLEGDCGDSLLLSRTVDVFDGQVTGILNRGEAEDLMLYPNPAIAEITVGGKNTIRESSSYHIVNTLGVTVLKGRFKDNTPQINIASLTPGIYFIKIIIDKKLITKKFEVKRP